MKVRLVVEVVVPVAAHLDPDPEGFTRGYVAGVLRGAGLDVETVAADVAPPSRRVEEDPPEVPDVEQPAPAVPDVPPPPPEVEDVRGLNCPPSIEPVYPEPDLRPYVLGWPGTGVTIPWGLDPDLSRRVVVHPVENPPPQESPQDGQEPDPAPDLRPEPAQARTARSRRTGGQPGRRRRGSVSKEAAAREDALADGLEEDEDLDDLHVEIEGRDGGKAQRDRVVQSKRPLQAPPMRSPRDEGLRPPDLDEVRERASQGVSGVWDR